MNWLLILILIGRLSGSTNGIATASFGSQEACESAVTAMEEWSSMANKKYPTATPYLHAFCVPTVRDVDRFPWEIEKDTP